MDNLPLNPQRLSSIAQECGFNNYEALKYAKELTEYIVKKEYKESLKILDKILSILKENQNLLVEISFILKTYEKKEERCRE